MASPACAPSGRVSISLHVGQLTRWASLAAHRPSSLVKRRRWPAQFGQSRKSPGLAAAGTRTLSPQSGQRTSIVSKSRSQEPLQAAAVEPDDDLVADHDDGNGHAPGLRDQLLAGGGILRDVLGRERYALRRKKLFR